MGGSRLVSTLQNFVSRNEKSMIKHVNMVESMTNSDTTVMSCLPTLK